MFALRLRICYPPKKWIARARLLAGSSGSRPSVTSSSLPFATSSFLQSQSIPDSKVIEVPESGWTTDNVRTSFIDFFAEKHSHTKWPSSKLVPSGGDESLLFVNSGMVQFKPIFEGAVPDTGHTFSGLQTATNSQKCIRAGGKHNDLDDVGRDSYHHTFFEMLGSWSFNSTYFKREAIDQAWELLTKVYCLPENQLYATYFAGCETLGLPPDFEARDFWLEHLPASHVLPGSAADNFWEMGETGPCGPCSELHFDRLGGGEGRDASHLVNMDDPDVLEIWNLVFIQFSRAEPGAALTPLSQNHIDTGMGLERLVSILQGRSSNYQIDVFQHIMNSIYDMRIAAARDRGSISTSSNNNDNIFDSASCKIERYKDRVGLEKDPDGVDEAYRVVADHARALVFAIADNVLPGSSGRGYVLRRILRRGILFGEHKLGLGPHFFSQLAPRVAEAFSEAYPELEAIDRVVAVIEDEENLFAETWTTGQADFDAIVKNMEKKGETVVSGKNAARLHQERGFPIDLTRLLAEQRGLSVDEEAFAEEQRKHFEASRQRFSKVGSIVATGDFLGLENCASELIRNNTGDDYSTDDSMKLEDLTRTMLPAKVLAFSQLVDTDGTGTSFRHRVIDGKRSGSGGPGTPVAIALNTTPFYTEAGGQASDRGIILWRNEHSNCEDDEETFLQVNIVDVQTKGGILWHMGYVEHGNCSSIKGRGDDVFCSLDTENRQLVSSNHTATHLLNLALRQNIYDENSDSCDQRGSSVRAERLRFDFALDRRVEATELKKIEDAVNLYIEKELPVFTKEIALDKAMCIQGVRAVFGESYPDPVRVVSIGSSVDELLVADDSMTSSNNTELSIELCGGTHARNTRQLKQFSLIDERGIAKGIRRVTCMTGEAAREASVTADNFGRLVDRLDQQKSPMSDLRAVAEKLDSADTVMPAYRKAELRSRVQGLIKRATKEAVTSSKKQASLLQQRGMDIAEEAGAEGATVRVEFIDMNMDPKTARKVLAKMRSSVPHCAFFIAAKYKDKIACYATGREGDHMDTLDASNWIKYAIAACQKSGGKGGGQTDYAQGNGVAVEDLQLLIDAANEFTNTLSRK